MSGRADAWAGEELARIEREGLLRQLEPLSSPQGAEIDVGGRRYLNFSSNDYLGLAADRDVVAGANATAQRHGFGAGASRLIVGDTSAHQALEAQLAVFFGAEAALLFNSGYAANVGVLSTVAGEGDVVFSDALNHASLVDGCRLSRARVVIYPHRDVAALRALLQTNPGRRRWVVTDSVFSMDGDQAPLVELSAVCAAEQAGLMVDEAHAVGVLGATGAGLCQLLGVKADLRVGTLGKALGGFGAFALSSARVRQWLVNKARSLIFSTSLPASVCGAASAALARVRDTPSLRERLWANIRQFSAGLQALGLPAHQDSAIFSVILGEPEKAVAASQQLREQGILAKAIRPPTVPKGTSRIRFALSAAHTAEQIEVALKHLSKLPRPQREEGRGEGSARSRTPELLAQDLAHVWHPFTQMSLWPSDEPLVIEKADGNWLIDTEGRRWLDAVSSLWVNVHGHRHPKLNEAIRTQLDKVAHSTLLGLANVPSIELAKKLVEVAPKGLTKVFYSDSGSTSVEVALKMAYQYWQLTHRPQKRRFAALTEAYHGDTLGSVSVGGMQLFHDRFRDLLFDVARVPPTLEAAERLLEREADTLAAFVVEPLVQGAAGMLMQPRGYLKGLAALCRKHDVLLICDEVATGFGRTGTMFAVEHEQVAPDFLCVAKGLTAGYLPLAATLTTQRVFEAFLGRHAELKTFFHGHTYTGNPLACAAALASLKLFETERTLERMQPVVEVLKAGLEQLAQLPHVAEVRQRGMMVGIELKGFAPEARMGFQVCQAARANGVLLRPLGNVIVLMPPLSLTAGEAKLLTDAVHSSLLRVGGGVT